MILRTKYNNWVRQSCQHQKVTKYMVSSLTRTMLKHIKMIFQLENSLEIRKCDYLKNRIYSF